MKPNRAIPLAMMLCIAIALSGTAVTNAQVITAGTDAWETVTGATSQDFSADPLPAGFFGPGSLPWAGVIDFEGAPPDTTLTADTFVTRLADAYVYCGGPEVYVPIQMTSLNLRSAGPIIVDYDLGYSELWEVIATASSYQNHGFAAFKKTCTDGGTFTTVLPVVPVLTFTRLDGSFTVTYEGDELVFESGSIGWVYALNTPGTLDTDGDGVAGIDGSTSNIMVGVDMSSCSCTAPPANKYVRELNEEQARWARHGVRGARFAQ